MIYTGIYPKSLTTINTFSVIKKELTMVKEVVLASGFCLEIKQKCHAILMNTI